METLLFRIPGVEAGLPTMDCCAIAALNSHRWAHWSPTTSLCTQKFYIQKKKTLQQTLNISQNIQNKWTHFPFAPKAIAYLLQVPLSGSHAASVATILEKFRPESALVFVCPNAQETVGGVVKVGRLKRKSGGKWVLKPHKCTFYEPSRRDQNIFVSCLMNVGHEKALICYFSACVLRVLGWLHLSAYTLLG